MTVNQNLSYGASNLPQLNNFLSILEKATQIGEKNFNNPESKANLANERTKLENQLKLDSFIKVPIVGDFSSGKSSLVNAFIGRELLPTNITPETAVCYELYYSDLEKIEVWNEGRFEKSGDLSQIGHITSSPGAVVKVFLNDEKVKKLNDKGIALVDMPGIDSGIEAHNNAIMNYIESGTSFIICVDAEQGTLRRSAIDFIQEIKKYQLSASIAITKIDKKPEDELQSIVEHVQDQAKRYISNDVIVVTTCSHKKDVAGLDRILYSLDANSLVKKKYGASVCGLVASVAKELDTQIAFLSSNKSNFEPEIEKLNATKTELIEKLNKLKNNNETSILSVNRILDSAEQAVLANIDDIARTIQQSQGNQDAIKEKVLSIVRPALVNSFRNEITSYNEGLKELLSEYENNLESILEEGIQKTQINFEMMEEKDNSAIISQLMLALTTLTKTLNPILKLAMTFMPQIINWLFGKNEEQLLNEIKEKISSSFLSQIKEAMKPSIAESFSKVKKEMTENLENNVKREISSIEDTIKAIMEKGEMEESTRKTKIQELKSSIESLNQLTA